MILPVSIVFCSRLGGIVFIIIVLKHNKAMCTSQQKKIFCMVKTKKEKKHTIIRRPSYFYGNHSSYEGRYKHHCHYQNNTTSYSSCSVTGTIH